MADDNGVVFARGDAGAELLAVLRLEVLFRSHEDVGGGVQPQELARPLLGQVVGNDKEGFVAQPQPLGFHGSGYHLEGLARAYLMGKEGVAAVEHMGDRVELVLPQPDLRVHARKGDVAAVVFAGSGGIEQLVIPCDQGVPPVGVAPYPVPESVPDGLLLLLGEGGFLAVEHAPLPAVRIVLGIVDAHVAQVQGIFKNLIGVCALRAVGHICGNIAVTDRVLVPDVPLGGEGGIGHVDHALLVEGRLEGLPHELPDIRGVDPRCAKPHLDFRSIKVFGLRLPQRLHVGQIAGAVNGGVLRLPQLLPDVAGEIFVRCLPLPAHRVEEDNAVQLVDQFVLAFAGELRHILHIHTGFFGDGQRQRLRSGVHAGHGLVRPYGSPGEHICLALEVFVLVQLLQRAEQIVGAVLGKGHGVGAGVNKPILCGEAVVEGIQLRLRLPDGFIRNKAVHLLRDELLHAVPQLHHALGTLLCGGVEVRLGHDAVLPVVQLPVHHGVGEVPHIRVCRDGLHDGLILAQIGQLRFRVGSTDIPNCAAELLRKVCAFGGRNGKVLPAVLRAFRGLPPQHHLRVVDEIPVDGKAVRVRSRVSPDTRVYPIGFDLNGSVPLLKKDNIRNDIRTGVGFERIVGQADRAEEVRALGDILPCGAVLGVHGVAGGDEGHHAARTHLIQRFCEKVVVDGKTELVKSPVADLILSKGYVAHGEVEEVLSVGGFKARHGNIRLGIELLCDSAGNTVQLHAVEPAAFHALRQHTEEVAHAHAGLQNIAGLEAHVLHRVVNGADNGGTGVVGVQRGRSGGGVFLRG